MFNKNTVLVSVAIVYREDLGKRKWLVVKKTPESDYELPRITVRKTESSARAAIRMCGEMLGANAQILEEAGRSGGVVTINGKPMTQKQIFYLLRIRSLGGEAIGFSEAAYMEFPQATKKLAAKRDKQMLKAARDEHKKWAVTKQKAFDEAEEAMNLEKELAAANANNN